MRAESVILSEVEGSRATIGRVQDLEKPDIIE
jgi:hypothetical protein